MNKTVLERILVSPRLPSLPSVALQILEMSSSSELQINRFARVIRNDQALAAKILRTVNSSYYGLTKPCGSIHQAIVYLGLNTVRALALSFTLVDAVNGADGDNVSFDYLHYWRRGLYSAVAAREIARLTHCFDPEEAFLAALMQDIGMPACFRALGDRYLQAIDLTGGDHEKLVAIEQRAFETDHTQVGAKVAAQWRLPPLFIDAIRHHHDAAAAPPHMMMFVRVIELSGIAAKALTHAKSEAVFSRFNRLGSEWFNLATIPLRQLVTVVTAGAAELAPLFRIDLGSPPDVDSLLDRAEEQVIAQQAISARGAAGAGGAGRS